MLSKPYLLNLVRAMIDTINDNSYEDHEGSLECVLNNEDVVNMLGALRLCECCAERHNSIANRLKYVVPKIIKDIDYSARREDNE